MVFSVYAGMKSPGLILGFDQPILYFGWHMAKRYDRLRANL